MNTIAGTLRFEGEIRYEALRRAIQCLIRDHESLRLHFAEKDGAAFQYVAPYEEAPIDFFDFSTGGGFEDLFRWDREVTARPFSLLDANLFYMAVLKIDEKNGGFYVKLHHLISDAWTMSIVGNEIMRYYLLILEGISPAPEVRPSFLEHLQKEAEYEVSDRFLRDKEYWNKKFEQPPETTVLKPQAMSSESIDSERKTFLTPQRLSDRIRAYCRDRNASVFTLFLSALSIYIYRATGEDDLVLGTTILNRINAREKETIGMFVSVAAPIRIRVRDDQDFYTFSDGMTKEGLAVLRHQKYPYNYLIRDLKEKHALDHRLYDIVLNYQNSKFKSDGLSDRGITSRWHFTGHQVESLVIHVNDRDDDGMYVINYDFLTDVYDPREIEFIHEHILRLLWHALDNPGRSIAKLEMLSEKEKHQILCEFNDTLADFPRERTLHSFLRERAKLTPDAPAVLFRDSVWSYSEINARANQLARTLIARGAGPDTVIGLRLDRSAEMIIAVQAILRAGGAYMPISPRYPEDRVRYMLSDSGAPILITTKEYKDLQDLPAQTLFIDEPSAYADDITDLPDCAGPQNLAYIIYTSGSTGNPKGVMIEHAGIVNRIAWMQKKYPIDETSAILQKTPYTFDVSVWELFWWSFVGARVVMLEPDGEKDPEEIIRAVERNAITTLHFVPSMLGAFLEYTAQHGAADRLTSLRQVFASGEALTLRHTEVFSRLLYEKNRTGLYNLYGPTEASVDVSYFDCTPSVSLKTVPIGRPIDNIRLYVMDKQRNLLPIGVPGELYIAGVGVARGYINNPTLTQDRFCPDPNYPGQVMYKTGDRVRWFPKGDIEYLGRLDFQVKVRGFRIELGEIETRLLSHPAILEAVVVGRLHEGTQYLCAYYVKEKDLTEEEIRNYLSRDLPDYMIPSFLIETDHIPLSQNGKADRNALPAPDFSTAQKQQGEDPANDTERRLKAIWTELLETDNIGVTESFFRIGGDSLRAIAMVTRIHKEFRADISVGEVFRLATIRKIAFFISEAKISDLPPVTHVSDADSYPLSGAESRLYVLKTLDPEDTSYNQPCLLEVDGSLDSGRLERAFGELIRRHESLRTSFLLRDGHPVRRIQEDVNFRLEQIAGDDPQGAMRDFIRPFDLSVAPLLRAGILPSSEKTWLFFDMHHIISDGSSIRVLIRDLAALYDEEPLPVLPVRYRDYAAWQNQILRTERILRSENFWLSEFTGELPVLNLPTDFSRPLRKSTRGRHVSRVFSEETTAAVRRFEKSMSVTPFMVLLSAYQILLSKYSSQRDIIVGTPSEGRLHEDFRGLIGMFVNTLPVRAYPDAYRTFSDFLFEQKRRITDIFDNQIYPFELLIDKLHVKRDIGRNPLFDTMFVLQPSAIDSIRLGEAQAIPAEYETGTAKFDLTLEMTEQNGTYICRAEYCPDLFREATVLRLLRHFENIVRAACSAPESRIRDIDMVSEEEKVQILHSFNTPTCRYPEDMTIHRIFESVAERHPDRIAVKGELTELTYRELDKRSNRVAMQIREFGVGKDDLVGLCLRRSPEMLIAILGVLKAGAAYLPMDPDYPPVRNRYILTDSRAALLILSEDFYDDYADSPRLLILPTADRIEPMFAPPPDTCSAHDLAYVIYTSGSTGNPKGVMIEHINVVRLLFNDEFAFDFSEADVWTLFHSYCFDFSVWEMYGALLYGGRLVLVPKTDARDTSRFYALLARERVTVLNQTPGAFYNLIEEDRLRESPPLSLRYVIFGGEALTPSLLAPFAKAHPETRLINMYGITETTVHVTYRVIGDAEQRSTVSNIGKPIPTLRTYILDPDLHLLPVGVPGEICVSGAGVGRGYLYNPELTATKFLDDPFFPGNRMYRSGDLARFLENGDMEYLGRMDNQVKIRGYRIELGEIETAVLRDKRVREVLVSPTESHSGDRKLCAYYVADKEIPADELRRTVKANLPDYMVPSYFIFLSQMPLNRNGKIDRIALPSVASLIESGTFEPPRTPSEKIAADVFAYVLEIPRVSVTDNFFDIGGDSLSSIRVTARLNELGFTLSLIDLYQYPTIRSLCDKQDNAAKEGAHGILLRLSGHPGAGRSMICFPYGGGMAVSYREFAEKISLLDPDLAVYAVHLPGHDVGPSEPFISASSAAELVTEEIEKLGGDILIYGHCAGTAPAYLTVKNLEERGHPPVLAFMGASFAPVHAYLYGRFFDPWAFRSDSNILRYLGEIGLDRNLSESGVSSLVLRAFRHDARTFYKTFAELPLRVRPLRTPCVFIAGEKDSITKNYEKKYDKWKRYFSRLSLRVIRGADHYFMKTDADILARIVLEETEKIRRKG